jgi:hypothetical protein
MRSYHAGPTFRLWNIGKKTFIDMPLDVPPLRGSRFGSPLRLSRLHWVRPERWPR